MKLTQVAKLAQRAVKLLLLLMFIYYLSVVFLIPTGKKIYLKMFPPKDLPNPIYGQLDPLVFEPKSIITSEPEYVLNTTNAKLPMDIPNRIVIYKFKPTSVSYGDGRSAQKDAEYLGYTDDELITDLKGDTYKWRDSTTGGSLEIQIHDKNLLLEIPLNTKLSQLTAGYSTRSEPIADATSLLKAINRLQDTYYIRGTQKVLFGKILNKEIIDIANPREGYLARVDFFRSIKIPNWTKDIPIVGPEARKGLLHIYLTKGSIAAGRTTIPLKIQAHYWEIDASDYSATYPIIPVDTAWTEVSNNKGIISYIKPKGANSFQEPKSTRVDKILINNIYLAFYETSTWQPYLQPIYVFEGNFTSQGQEDGEIVVYYPAIHPAYTKTPAE